jgi:cytochrome d ubiquinol oxidase subunit II
MFVATSAYLAAVFLVGDAHRSGEPEMERYFARRALAAAAVGGLAAAAGLVELHAEARYVFDRLVDQGLPLVILSALCGLGLLAALLRGWRRPLRPLAAGAVVAVIWGWGVAQFPYLLPTSLKIGEAAAPGPTLNMIFGVFGAAAIFVLPSLALLYSLSQRDLLEHER